ncbi:hypothetical protein M5D96_005126, partial [Drosophila gunungcola]
VASHITSSNPAGFLDSRHSERSLGWLGVRVFAMEIVYGHLWGTHETASKAKMTLSSGNYKSLRQKCEHAAHISQRGQRQPNRAVGQNA